MFGNMTAVDDYWDWTALRRGRVQAAYKDLHDPVEREFWDQVSGATPINMGTMSTFNGKIVGKLHWKS